LFPHIILKKKIYLFRFQIPFPSMEKKNFSEPKNTYQTPLKRVIRIAWYTYLVELYYEKLCTMQETWPETTLNSEDIVQKCYLWECAQQRENIWILNILYKNYLFKSVYNEFVDSIRKDIAIFPALEKKVYLKVLDTVFLQAQDHW